MAAVILEPPKIKPDTVSTVSPSISHEVMGPDAMILDLIIKFLFWKIASMDTVLIFALNFKTFIVSWTLIEIHRSNKGQTNQLFTYWILTCEGKSRRCEGVHYMNFRCLYVKDLRRAVFLHLFPLNPTLFSPLCDIFSDKNDVKYS